MENSRLGLDAAKSKAKSSAGGRGMNPDDEMVSEESRAEIEQKEDDFVGQTEEAVGVMKNVRFSPAYLSKIQSLGVSLETRHWQLLTISLPWKQVLDTPEPLRNLADLIAAQLEFHKKAYEILSDLEIGRAHV